jgi:hypothetical protein
MYGVTQDIKNKNNELEIDQELEHESISDPDQSTHNAIF